MTGPVAGTDGLRAARGGPAPADYRAYHDDEWGRPVHGDDALFERITLEAFQSGLSWLTILRKREAFRAAFAGVRPGGGRGVRRRRRRAAAGRRGHRAQPREDRGRRSPTPGPSRRRSTGRLDALLWSFAPDAERGRRRGRLADVPAITPESTAMAKELKRRGFRFVGPTTAYALMQATGLVDDHLAGCAFR